MNFRTILAAASCLIVPVAAHAQPVTGPYVSLGGGIAIQTPDNYRFHGSGASGKIQWRPGYTVMGGIGYGFGDGLRVEIDGDYLHTTAHKVDGGGFGQGRIHGQERNYGGLINVFYDIPVGLPVFPFVGAGAGYQAADFAPQLGNATARVFGTRASFAYDLIGGVSYPVAAVPGLSVTAEYRFMQLTSHRFYTGSFPTGLVKIGQESSHSVLLGLRYQIFNPPPPAPVAAVAPVAAPAPAQAKTYLVFFDWDKYSLTPHAISTLAQAAADSKTDQTTTVEVSGYTDTSGTPKYNLALSWRRAKAVAAQLVADGVPASEIETHGYGETHLLVPTGPGVREAQNRRVEIVLQ